MATLDQAVLVSDTIANDNDKVVLTVTIGSVYKIKSGYAHITTTATAGSRTIRFHFRDENDVIIYEARPLAALLANNVEIISLIPGGTTADHSTTVGYQEVGIPADFTMNSAWTIRIFDNSDRDSNDDFLVHFVVEKTI